LFNFYLCVYFTGCCTFDEPLSSCGYSQSDDDDLNWDQVNAPIKPSSGQGMPSGWSSILLCFSLTLAYVYIQNFLTVLLLECCFV